MKRGKEGKERIVLIDPITKKIIFDPRRELDTLQRKIREAALIERKWVNGKRWNVPHGQGPELNEDPDEKNPANIFFSEITLLIRDHKSYMDKEGFVAEVQANIDKKLKRAEECITSVILGLGIPKRKCKALVDPLMQKLRKEMERCLRKPPNRMDQMVNEVVCMNPRSDPWRKREDDLIKRIVGLYAKYTPLKKKDGKINVLRITHNLVLIFKACGMSDIGKEALRKQIASIHTT